MNKTSVNDFKISRRCAVAALAGATTLRSAEESYYPPPDKDGGWRTIKDPDKLRSVGGIDIEKMDAAFEYVKSTSQHGGLIVVRHGWLVYEKYFGRGNRQAFPESRSCAKCISSIATGMAIHDKPEMIPDGLDEKIISPKYLPEWFFPLDDPRKGEIRLGHILAMSSGLRGSSPSYIDNKPVVIDPPERPGFQIVDEGALLALRLSLWCDPGGGYSYCSSGTQFLSMLVRKLIGKEMDVYVRERIAEPSGWGDWAWATYRPRLTAGVDSTHHLLHTPGAGSICLKPTDVLRYLYLLLHEGKWGSQQLVPADYIRIASRPVKYNTHYPYSLMFETNTNGHRNAPRDLFSKGGAGGFGWYVIPSLDMVVYKMAGIDSDYDPQLSGLPVHYQYDGSRANVTIDRQVSGASEGKAIEAVVAAVLT